MPDPTPLPLAIDGIPAGRFILKLLWIGVRLIACAYIGHSGARFFYQGF